MSARAPAHCGAPAVADFPNGNIAPEPGLRQEDDAPNWGVLD